MSTEKQTGGAEVEVMQKQASKREDSHDKFPTHTQTLMQYAPQRRRKIHLHPWLVSHGLWQGSHTSPDPPHTQSMGGVAWTSPWRQALERYALHLSIVEKPGKPFQQQM